MSDTRPGLGVMLHMLAGTSPKAVVALKEAVGKTIRSMEIDPDYNRDGGLLVRFTDGTGIAIYDDGRSCCENRYMTTDDDLSYHVGGVLRLVTVEDGPTVDNEWGEPHEIEFLRVGTSKGVVTCETHNEHNGYYGGFWLTVRPLEGTTDE